MQKGSITSNQDIAQWLSVYFSKMKGQTHNPLKVDIKDMVTALAGAFITIFILSILTRLTHTEWLIAPFGSSCLLVFIAWNAPLSQPRNIIGGHFISTLIGLIVFHFLGNTILSIAIAVPLAIVCMMFTKTLHPPAGANPIIVILGAYQWSYLFSPVLIGSMVIVVVALLINNMRKNRAYPTFWL